MALLFVLWLMTILCVVAMEMKFASHLHMQVTAALGQETKTLFYARAGVERAIADMVLEKNAITMPLEQREIDEADYRDVPVGDGTYTLYAGMDVDGQHRYGLRDECAKINVSTTDPAVLAKIPGLSESLAADIAALRQHEPIQDLGDLLKLENVTLFTLYGEDQNRNGILDPNEDDGDRSWPSDNADGHLDSGLSAYLTVWSAIHEVSLDNKARIKLNKAGADEITKAIKDINQQQADSIVAYRDKKKFGSIAELLDVELVEKVEQKGQPARKGSPKQSKPETDKEDKNKEQNASEDLSRGGSKKGEAAPGKNQGNQTTRSTGVKAFDTAAFKRVADFVTIADEDVTRGLVNINTASEEVLACLPGIDEGLARRIVSERDGMKDHYKSVADLLDVNGMTTELFKGLCMRITARSDVFEARSFGALEGSKSYRCVSAILDRTEDEFHIRAWKEIE
ncbi:MAG: helix-hairpin-helix domain-containing protein [Candidatus Hydrogenedentes bacterium]|nr:helix-hairpin-helix domain-containing protein [Candidatus Hydrogenedentota bacterium]